MILEHGVIWTGDPALPWAEAIHVADGTIRSVGSDADLAGAGADVRIDLGGAFVCPGLIDAHAHVLVFGLQLDRVDLVGAASLDETLGRIAVRVARLRSEEASGWIEGRGWDQNDWPDTRFPHRTDLDRVSGDFPAALGRIDGHALWVNTRALELAGITAATPDPPGGAILRDPDGSPSGILVDNAEILVDSVIPDPDPEAKRRAIRTAIETLARDGITGVHDMGMTAEELAIYRDLAATERLGVRIYASISATDPDLDTVLAGGPDPEWAGGWFRLGMVKFYLDGALGSRGAALLAPYSDDPDNRGLLVTEPDALLDGLRRSADAGFQVALHAIGDRGNRLALDSWDRVVAEVPGRAAGRPVAAAPLSLAGSRPAILPPFRIEHAQIIEPGDLDRFARLGAVASMQPTHCTSDMPWAPERLGTARLAGAYAWRSLVNRGVVLVSGSDFPVERHEPRYGLHAAVTRVGVDGTPVGGWSPHERLGREEALVSFTAAPAYASGDLHRLGTLTPGKRADFVVFDRNLVTCDPGGILDARAWLTVVDGAILWRDPEAPIADGAR